MDHFSYRVKPVNEGKKMSINNRKNLILPGSVFLPFQIASIGHILQGNWKIEFNGFKLIVSRFNLGHVASKLIVATGHGREVLRKK